MFKDVFKRAFVLMFAGTVLAILLVIVMYSVHIESLVRELFFASTILSLLLVLVCITILYFKYLQKVYEYVGLIAEGKSVQITPQIIQQSKIFRGIYRVGRRYSDLLLHSESLSLGKISNVAVNRNTNDLVYKSVTLINEYLHKLKTEEEEWKAKENIRNWTNQGIALFSDLLRSNRGTNYISQRLLTELVKYLGYNQGGVFLLSNSDGNNNKLEMVAAYAYDREKATNINISSDEGLLSAVCFEKQSIYMNDLPANYMNISSGLGNAGPRCLFLVPLITDNQVIGAIELASFTEMKEYEREFIEKIAENFAATVSANRLNETTSELLKQSQEQAENLSRQEEELKLNMQEMHIQKEEMQIKQKELEESENLMRKIIDMIPFPIFIKNDKRRYIVANKAQAKLFNTTADALLGCADNDLISNRDELNEIFKSDQRVLLENETVKLPEQSISLPDGTKRILQTIKVPFDNNVTGNSNILGVSYDFTGQRKVEQELKEKEKQIEWFKKKMETMGN